MLGGSSERMQFAAEFWQSQRNLEIWVSDYESNLDKNRRIFQQFGVPNGQLRFDGRATDTVTNFTTLVKDFVKQKLQHLYLITSDYHMRRARAMVRSTRRRRSQLLFLGVTVLWLRLWQCLQALKSQNLCCEWCEIAGDRPLGGSSGASLLWILIGRTGASFNPRLEKF